MRISISKRLSALAVVALGMLAFASPAWAETFTVTNTDDSGDGSLRAALVSAAADHSTADVVVFGSGVQGEILLTSALPELGNVDVRGPGADEVTVRRSGAAPEFFGIFTVGTGRTAKISDLTISGGRTLGTGGGIYNGENSTLTVEDSIVSGNSARLGGCGIGTDISSTLNVVSSTLVGNSCEGVSSTPCRGGGIFFALEATGSITNSTVANNTADVGGGISLGGNDAAPITVTGSTISSNSARMTGGGIEIFRTPTRVVLRNSIAAGNSAGSSDPDVYGELASGSGFNLIGGTASRAGLDTDASGNPVLKDNGGPTPTIALLKDSPAIDKGNAFGTTTDQRGFARPQDITGVTNTEGGNGSDIGAVEAVSASISGVTVTEGNSDGGGNAAFTVRLSNPLRVPVEVDYATEDGTAVSTGASPDYSAAFGTLTFAPDDTEETVNVHINGDTTDEPDETFLVKLSDVRGANSILGDGAATGTIADDDEPPALSVDDVSVNEGDSGPTEATFTVGLDAPSGKTVGVNYATADGTVDGAAKAGEDYVSTPGSLSFSPGAVTRTVSVPVNGDDRDEPDEAFLLNLSGEGNATIADGRGRATIVNDDATPEAVDDSYTINTDSRLVIEAPGVLEGDEDADGGTLSTTALRDPTHGVLSFKPDGSFKYAPDPGFVGMDSFTYKASDGTNESNTATVSITVNPVAEPPAPNAAPTVTALTPKPGARLRDRTPTIRATVADGETDLARGDIRLWVDGKSVGRFSYDPATDRLSYASRKLDHGRHTVLIVARDGAGLSESKFWTFRVGR